jgi:hypothetical protein
MKRQWEKPRLIVLVRGNPQEAILQVCKEPSVGDTPESTYEGCSLYSGGYCPLCDPLVAS